MSIKNVTKKFSSTLHAVFNVIFGNVDFVIVVFNIHGRKMRFSASSQKSEKSIFGKFGANFCNV